VANNLGILQGYYAIARRSADATLSFAWTFGLVCFAMLLAAAGLVVDILVFDAPRDQLGIAAIGAALGGLGTLWCIRMRRRRLALRARWRTAADSLATSIGGRLLDLDATVEWLTTHWRSPIRIEDFAHSQCAHTIATPSALIHFEPEGTKDDSELPEAHLVVYARGARSSSSFAIEHVEGDTIARLDEATRTRLLATPESFADVTPLVRSLLG
jgi:hypothetical protein